MNSTRGHALRFASLLLLAACSSPSNDAGPGGSGGSSGGVPASTGGQGPGGNATGGSLSTGGSLATGGTTPATGGAAGIPGTGGAPGTGGTVSPTGGGGGRDVGGAGTASGGTPPTGGANNGGSAGTAGGSGGQAGNAGRDAGGTTASGGSAGTTASGGSAGKAGAGGSAGAGGAATSFTCNQVTAMTLTREWFEAGFQQNPGMVDGRWQLKAREHGYITEWANPNSDFWNEMIESPCTSGSTSPDHVILTVLSWVPACCTTQAEWETQIVKAINTFKSKYAGLKRIDLMTVIRGPGNKLCPTAPAAGESIVMPPELDAALASSAAQFPGLAFVGPPVEGPNCAAFSGGGPHLTSAGNSAVAKTISAYFVNLQ